MNLLKCRPLLVLYLSFSCFTLACNLYSCFPDLSNQFTREVQEFVKQLYKQGQTVLQNREGHMDGGDKQSKDFSSFSLTIDCNVACVELLLWAIRDEPGMLIEVKNS